MGMERPLAEAANRPANSAISRKNPVVRMMILVAHWPRPTGRPLVTWLLPRSWI